jgi:Tfp pilus assembly protein PilV
MRRGFSMLEVMIAGTIFLLALAGVVSGYRTANGIYEHQRRTTVAISIAEFEMEELLLRYSSDASLDVNAKLTAAKVIADAVPVVRCLKKTLEELTCPAVIKNADGSARLTTPDPTIYVVASAVTDAPGVGGLKYIRMTTSWSESSGDKSISLDTYRP